MTAKTEQELLAANDDSEASIDKIRQILFGGQMQSYEKKLVALNARIEKLLSQQSESFAAQFSTVTHSLEQLAKDHSQNLQNLSDDSLQKGKSTDAAIEKLQLAVSEWQKESDAQQTKVSDSLHSEIANLETELVVRISNLEEGLSRLQEAQSEQQKGQSQLRHELARLFTGFAEQMDNGGQDAPD